MRKVIKVSKLKAEQAKKMQEAEQERLRIQSLLRNKYYFNNFAMPLGVDPKKFKLKTRFPLQDMVIEDDDFMASLIRRREDIKQL